MNNDISPLGLYNQQSIWGGPPLSPPGLGSDTSEVLSVPNGEGGAGHHSLPRLPRIDIALSSFSSQETVASSSLGSGKGFSSPVPSVCFEKGHAPRKPCMERRLRVGTVQRRITQLIDLLNDSDYLTLGEIEAIADQLETCYYKREIIRRKLHFD